jgi:hypothetical protein
MYIKIFTFSDIQELVFVKHSYFNTCVTVINDKLHEIKCIKKVCKDTLYQGNLNVFLNYFNFEKSSLSLPSQNMVP